MLKIFSALVSVDAAGLIAASALRFALTAAHVVPSDGPFEAIFKDKRIRATKEAIDEANDIALVRLDSPVEGIQPLPFSFDVRRGDSGYIYGFNRSLDWMGLSIDITVQDTSAKYHGRPSLLALLPPNIKSERALIGMSGAPMIVGGATVGIVVGTLRDNDFSGFLFATPIQEALNILPPAQYERAKRKALPTPTIDQDQRTDIGVISALDEELDYLFDLPYEWSGLSITVAFFAGL